MVNIYELLLKEILHCPLVVNHWRSQSFPWFIKHDLGTKITLIWTNKIYQTMQMLKILSTLGECIRGNVFVAQKYLTRKTFYLFIVLFSIKFINQRILNRILLKYIVSLRTIIIRIEIFWDCIKHVFASLTNETMIPVDFVKIFNKLDS